MKSFYFKILLMVFIIAATIAHSYADENKKLPAVLMLSDSASGFPVLKNLFDSGFFAANNFLTQYSPVDKLSSKDKSAENFSLASGLKSTETDEQASFTIFTNDSLRQNIMIRWDIPRKNSYRQKKSIQTMTDFAYNLRSSTMPDTLAQTAGFSDVIENVSVNYKDNNGTEVSGYDLTVHTGFSPTHRFVRTLSELTILTGVGMANYWINKDANMEDWRYKYRWEDVWPRFRDGWSYDTNAFRTNTVYHIYAGAVYYQIARSNEYGIAASAAWAFTGSFIWEYVGEWRERSSANDMIFTSFGGALVGEAFRQSSIYVDQCLPNSVYGKIFSFLLDPMRIINRALDRYFDGDYKVSVVFMNPAAQAIIDKSKNK
ncbi:MAG: DUF3943 domain-containing protein [Spirochaetota bacterium]